MAKAIEFAYTNDWPGDPDEVEIVFTDGSRVMMCRRQYEAMCRADLT